MVPLLGGLVISGSVTATLVKVVLPVFSTVIV
jgi:hypothetical protein